MPDLIVDTLTFVTVPLSFVVMKFVDVKSSVVGVIPIPLTVSIDPIWLSTS